jgi:predicted alpha/beta hydrolase
MATEYTQEFLDRGGDRLGLQVYPDTPDSPVVVIWPAMAVPARYYRPFARELTAEGLSVVVVDLRGTGTSTPGPSRRSGYGYTELTGDVGAVLEALKPRTDGRRVILLGHSLGGQICALYLAVTEEAGVDGLALVAVGLPWYRSYPGRHGIGVLAFTQAIAAVSAVLGVWPGWGFGGRQARGVIRDWGYTARHGTFPAIDGTDMEAALARMVTPVLAISVDDDQYTPPATLDQLCAKMSAAPVQRAHLTAIEAGARIDHVKWVRASSTVAARVSAFANTVGWESSSQAVAEVKEGRGPGTLLP